MLRWNRLVASVTTGVGWSRAYQTVGNLGVGRKRQFDPGWCAKAATLGRVVSGTSCSSGERFQPDGLRRDGLNVTTGSGQRRLGPFIDPPPARPSEELPLRLPLCWATKLHPRMGGQSRCSDYTAGKDNAQEARSGKPERKPSSSHRSRGVAFGLLLSRLPSFRLAHWLQMVRRQSH